MTTASVPRTRGLLRTYVWWILAIAVVTVVVSLGVAERMPASYTSTARVLVTPEQTHAAPLMPNMGNEKEIALSGDVADRAATRLGVSVKAADRGLSVSALVDTTVLEFACTASNRLDAFLHTEAFSQSYVDYRNDSGHTRVAEVISVPTYPTTGQGANLPMVLGAGLLAGLMLGLGIVWAWDRLSDRFRGADDVERHTGLPVLARVPQLEPGALAQGQSESARRAFGHVAARLSSLLEHRRRGAVVLVTSPRRGAGTTTIALETATALVSLGRNVVLIDAHAGHDGLGSRLRLQGVPGFSEVLDGECGAEGLLRPTDLPGLHVLPAGAGETGSVGMNLDNLQVMVGGLSSRYIVVIDGPALLEASEALVLADHSDFVLLVADGRQGTRADAAHAVALLQTARAQLPGWLYNVPTSRRRRQIRLTTQPAEPARETAMDTEGSSSEVKA